MSLTHRYSWNNVTTASGGFAADEQALAQVEAARGKLRRHLIEDARRGAALTGATVASYVTAFLRPRRG